MSKVYITEFQNLAHAHVSGVPIPVPAATNAVTSQAIDIGSDSVQNAVVNAKTTIIRVFAEADCFIAIGVNPDATAAPVIPLAANQTDYFGIGQGERIAVVERSP